MAIVCTLFLSSCEQAQKPKLYPKIDNYKIQHVVYLRNFEVDRLVANAKIGGYKNGVINFQKIRWKDNFVDKILYNIIIESAKKEIKITNFINLKFLDCYIDQLFYDFNKQEAIVNFHINYAGNMKSFIIIARPSTKENIELSQDDINHLFDDAFIKMGVFIADFISKHIKT
jgi:hypothetical protein